MPYQSPFSTLQQMIRDRRFGDLVDRGNDFEVDDLIDRGQDRDAMLLQDDQELRLRPEQYETLRRSPFSEPTPPRSSQPPMPPSRREFPFEVLRKSTGNLAPMLNRYGLADYGNVEEGTGPRGPSSVFPGAGARAGTKVTMYGDPIDAEVSRMKQLRQQAVDSRALNQRYLESHLGPETAAFKADPYRSMLALESGQRSYERANPLPPQPGMLSNVEAGAVLRDFMSGDARAREAARAQAISGAETFMDPTVTAGRGLARREAELDAQQKGYWDVAGRLAASQNFFPTPEQTEPYFPSGGGQAGPPGADAGAKTLSLDDLRIIAQMQGLTLDQAVAVAQRRGWTIGGR
jgi:hypothetical protein